MPVPTKANIRLRTKLMVVTVLLLTLVILLVITLVDRNLRRVIREETQKRGIAIARLFGATNLNFLKNYYTLPIQQNAQAAKLENELSYIIVYDKEGKIAANTEDEGILGTMPTDLPSLASLSADVSLFREIEANLKGSTLPQRVFDIAVPVRTGETPVRWGTVRIGISPANMDRHLGETQIAILQIGLLSLLFGIIGSVLLANRITTPISKLVEGSLRAAKGDLSHRIEVSSRDELEGLAANFNYMMDQIKAHQEERIKSERMAAIGYMVNTIVHDCRTPITVIKGFASLLKDFEVSPEQERQCLDFINFEVERMERMIEEILQFSTDKKTPLRLEECDLDEFVRECGTEIGILLRNTQTRFSLDLQSRAMVKIDREKLRRAVLNVAANSKEALKGLGEFCLATHHGETHAIIRLSDTGNGIPEQIRQKIFDPFFTHGKSGGFGLGMSITKKIVEDHSGKILLESESGKGTTFLIQIPLCEQGEARSKVQFA